MTPFPDGFAQASKGGLKLALKRCAKEHKVTLVPPRYFLRMAPLKLRGVVVGTIWCVTIRDDSGRAVEMRVPLRHMISDVQAAFARAVADLRAGGGLPLDEEGVVVLEGPAEEKE